MCTRARGRAWILLLAALTAGSPAASEPVVRVLLLESAGPVSVAGRTLAPGPGGVYAGDRDLGPVWRAEGQGPYRAENLRVRGALEVRQGGLGLQVVNEVPLEDYVAGSLGREVYSRWQPEALKAQAVVTRTYVLHKHAERTGDAFDVAATTRDQVYGGIDAENAAVRAAVEATRGQILVHGSEPILAVFHSASGGRTASAEEVWGRPLPYLVSVPVEGEEDSPDTYWRASVSGTTLGRALAPLGLTLGPVREVRIAERTPSGRVRWVSLRGTEGSGRVSGRDLRTALGASVIRSTLFEVRTSERGFTFVGSGHGHGVGMSQWGAQAMARNGADYRRILHRFYPGTRLVRTGGR